MEDRSEKVLPAVINTFKLLIKGDLPGRSEPAAKLPTGRTYRSDTQGSVGFSTLAVMQKSDALRRLDTLHTQQLD